MNNQKARVSALERAMANLRNARESAPRKSPANAGYNLAGILADWAAVTARDGLSADEIHSMADEMTEIARAVNKGLLTIAPEAKNPPAAPLTQEGLARRLWCLGAGLDGPNDDASEELMSLGARVRYEPILPAAHFSQSGEAKEAEKPGPYQPVIDLISNVITELSYQDGLPVDLWERLDKALWTLSRIAAELATRPADSQ